MKIRNSKISNEDALISIMAMNDFDRITINSIAENADDSRGRIYLQYKDNSIIY